MTTRPEKVLYRAVATATGGRGGRARTSDGILDVALRPPPEMGGPGGATNPEQLFAAGYAACFQSSLAVAGRRAGIDASESVVSCEVSMGPTGQAYALAVALEVSIPGVGAEQVQELADAAHAVCPYSNATRGNVAVDIVTAGSVPQVPAGFEGRP